MIITFIPRVFKQQQPDTVGMLFQGFWCSTLQHAQDLIARVRREGEACLLRWTVACQMLVVSCLMGSSPPCNVCSPSVPSSRGGRRRKRLAAIASCSLWVVPGDRCQCPWGRAGLDELQEDWVRIQGADFAGKLHSSVIRNCRRQTTPSCRQILPWCTQTSWKSFPSTRCMGGMSCSRGGIVFFPVLPAFLAFAFVTSAAFDVFTALWAFASVLLMCCSCSQAMPKRVYSPPGL